MTAAISIAFSGMRFEFEMIHFYLSILLHFIFINALLIVQYFNIMPFTPAILGGILLINFFNWVREINDQCSFRLRYA